MLKRRSCVKSLNLLLFRHEHETEPIAERGETHLGCGTETSAGLFAPEKPEDVYSIQVPCLPRLENLFKNDHRGVLDVLGASDKLVDALKLKGIPNYSTLKYFADGLDLDAFFRWCSPISLDVSSVMRAPKPLRSTRPAWNR
ncbi:MAG: hypothetical protein ACRC2T_03285 [Thermoguttaceae bacterium]